MPIAGGSSYIYLEKRFPTVYLWMLKKKNKDNVNDVFKYHSSFTHWFLTQFQIISWKFSQCSQGKFLNVYFTIYSVPLLVLLTPSFYLYNR